MDNVNWVIMILGAGCAGYIASQITRSHQRPAMMIGHGFLGVFAMRTLLQDGLGYTIEGVIGHFIAAVIGACGVILLRQALFGPRINSKHKGAF